MRKRNFQRLIELRFLAAGSKTENLALRGGRKIFEENLGSMILGIVSLDLLSQFWRLEVVILSDRSGAAVVLSASLCPTTRVPSVLPIFLS